MVKEKEQIEIEIVDTYTLDELINKNNVKEIHILQIDTEGHESTILKNYSFRLKPDVIHYEHKHLTYAEHDDLKQHIQSYGYRIHEEKFDSTAVLVK